MRTKKMVLFLMTVILVLIAVMFCSCDLFGDKSSSSSGTKKTGNESSEQTTGDEGWTPVDNPNVYNALILGCTNVAFQGSKTAVSSNKGVLTIDSKFKVSLGETALWLIAKAKYKETSPRDNTIVSIDLSTEENPSADSRVVSLYVYKDELYVALGNDDKDTENGKNNKVKFSLRNVPWEQYFPYEMEKMTSVDIRNLSAALIAGVTTNRAVKAEYRHSKEGDEYRYMLDIDLDATLSQLFTAFATTGAISDLDIIQMLKEFVAVFYGVEEKDISDGKLPESTLVVNFQTVGNVISSLKLDFDVDLSGRTQLFSGGEMKGTAAVESLTIGNDYSTLKIPFVSDTVEMKKYIAFSDTIFAVRLPLEEYKAGKATPDKTLLKVTTKVFQGSAEKDFLFAEYSNAVSGELLKGLYIYDNILYFYALDDHNDFSCIASMNIKDAGELATNVVANTMGGNSQFYPTKLLAYIINGVSIDQSGIKFSIKPNFYTDVWYNFEDFCDYINSFTAEEMKDIAGIEEFYNYVKTNEVIITMGTHDPFFSVLASDDPTISTVVRMLGGVSDETRLAPAEN